jgi:hypothetical protein
LFFCCGLSIIGIFSLIHQCIFVLVFVPCTVKKG